ncbi:hypothetical protein CRE_11168 [Caenorhabditis remanei]|uniref:F-box domain-containing protein n=1 Tax=Caenorhabditis remanei TaxID=31234 RepID=E3MQ44_CAERE|nr:hypothetical protein CRE_11168 [Caenorhabditis remanei]
MENSKPFPLLRLPRLAIEEVMSTMSPFEIINISMTSLKIKYFIKSFLRTSQNSQYNLQLIMNKEPIVSIKGSEVYFEFQVTSDKTKDGMRVYKECLMDEKFDTFWTYSEDLLDCWTKVVKTVKETIKFTDRIFHFEIDTCPTRNKSIVDFIKSETPSIECCKHHGKAETDDNIKYFFNNINVTNGLSMIVRLSNSFKLPQANDLNNCSLDPANWLTFDQFLQFKGSYLCIYGSPLTSYELNQFLILWMASQCHQNLSFFLININHSQSIDTIFNLPHEIMNPNLERIARLSNNTTIPLKGGIEIKRDDGMTGTINFGWRLDKMLLQMVVSRFD